MKKDIIKYFEPFCKRFKLSLTYIPDTRPDREAYILHYRGRSVLSVNTKQFFQIPKLARTADILARLKVGLSGALNDEKTREQVYQPHRWGKIIIK